MGRWFDKLVGKNAPKPQRSSILKLLQSGSLYNIGDMRSDSSLASIRTRINTMRALARDSQIDTALSYYATDATTPNSLGQIIWATPIDDNSKEVSDIVNEKFKQWRINEFARDHILELATVGNLYVPTTMMYKDYGDSSSSSKMKVAIDNNTIPDSDYDIIPSYKIMPEDIIHIYREGQPQGYMYSPSDSNGFIASTILYPEDAVIHFSLGGLLGEYTITVKERNSNENIDYDIKFAKPLMEGAVQPTQTLSLLEDALLLSSLSRTVKFINVDVGTTEEEDEIAVVLQQLKDTIEQQLTINTSTGDAQSFLNPQSPNNLVYIPKVNGNDAISITDLNMADSQEADNKLLQYYQDKKLSVLGVPKEAMNFSSSEGLGGAGAVMSQRSALYANSLSRIETAYISGWTDALNKYFDSKNLSGFKDKFVLHMNPIITELSQVQSDKRDGAISQAQSAIDLLKSVNIENDKLYKDVITEILSETIPGISTQIQGESFHVNTEEGDEF